MRANRKLQMDTFHQMYDQYKLKKAEVHIETTEWGRGIGRKWLESCDKDINIKVVGVFDTVSSFLSSPKCLLRYLGWCIGLASFQTIQFCET